MSARVRINTESGTYPVTLRDGDTISAQRDGVLIMPFRVDLPKRVSSVVGVRDVPGAPRKLYLRQSNTLWAVTGEDRYLTNAEVIQRLRDAVTMGGTWKVLAQ